ncbi:MAG: sigma-E processing peptidase SpoIIGA [Clostridia bacterium]|nr:sigma-E processing peptidase SpoIIGA [Clostridia bacterium]
MSYVIYVDVLIFLNIIVTFLLLLATSGLLKNAPSSGRYILGSLFGGISSLLIFAPEMGLFVSLIVKFLFSLIIVCIVYKPKTVRLIAKDTGYFLVVNFIFAGMMMFAASLPGINLVQYKNGAAYINLSFFSLIGACFICYLVTCLLGKITNHKPDAVNFTAEIEHNGKKVCQCALYDSGNALRDPFTGESLIIADISMIRDIVPESICEYFLTGVPSSGIKLVVCNTVASQGLLPCFRVNKVKIYNKETQYIFENAEIAVTDRGLDNIILPSDLSEKTERRTGYDKKSEQISAADKGISDKN